MMLVSDHGSVNKFPYSVDAKFIMPSVLLNVTGIKHVDYERQIQEIFHWYFKNILVLAAEFLISFPNSFPFHMPVFAF